MTNSNKNNEAKTKALKPIVVGDCLRMGVCIDVSETMTASRVFCTLPRVPETDREDDYLLTDF